MSYLVLARKWRPQVFEDVVGQRTITQTLQNAIALNRVAHAFLFTGARGVGKTSTARILAKALNCEKGPQINPCNQCIHCREITEGHSMDVIEIDGASNRGIEEIRELRENVRYTPSKSRYKIYIIDEVHMLTREAFNALLKTLEEPPPHIIFIFATTEPHKIPATILSRCQRYDFKRIPLKEIFRTLRQIAEKEEIRISPRSLMLIAQESEGSMRDAQSLLDQVISYSGKEVQDEEVAEVLGVIDRKILFDTVEAIAHQDAEKCIEIVDHLYHYGYDIQHFCEELLQYLRNLILTKVSKHPEELLEVNGEELEELKKQAEKFQFEQLDQLFHLLLKGEQEVHQSTFPRTLLEITLIRMATLKSVVPIDEIIEKLERMEVGKGENHLAKETVQPILKEIPIFKNKNREEEKEQPHSPQEEKERPSPIEEKSIQTRPCEEEAWKGLVEFARAKNPILGSFLVFGKILNFEEGRIEIGFERDSFHYERIMEKNSRSQLESVCEEYFRKKMKVVISPIKEGGRINEREIINREKGFQNLGRGGLANSKEEHGVIQEALRLFNGKIVEK
ncbi:MAG: DNA polymerase III subunit gamma/tau [Thermodesulfobacteriota bacterium]